MFPNRSTASNHNIVGKFVTKSTTKNPQNNINDNCDRKLSLDVIYSELQFFKEENVISINEINNRLDKLEINIDDSLFVKLDNYRADEERKKASLKELHKRIDNFEKMENVLAALTRQVAAFQNELIATKTSGEVQNAEKDYDPHSLPIIDLPPLVAVEKDKDSSDVLFKSRVQLFKYTDGEWKGRGVGAMKILKTKASVDPLKPVRLLMRRDQLRNICCNQRVTKSVPTFTEMDNEKSVCWVGNDFSDGSSVTEIFAIKFSSIELLNEFKDIIKNIQDAITEQ